jgi:deoxyribodipyrimidine photo-lyase
VSGTVALCCSAVPSVRVRGANERPVRTERDVVLYWMTAFRRTRYNFALQRAIEWGNHLNKPVVVLEALRVDYPWASDRFHRFILDGMAANRDALASTPVAYYPYVEQSAGAGRGLLSALASRACIVVTDDFRAFFIPAANAAAARKIDVALECVDSNGIHALAGPGRAFDTARAFRRWLQQNIVDDLAAFPEADPLRHAPPLRATIPTDITDRWPEVGSTLLDGDTTALARLPIDHAVAPVGQRGGSTAGELQLARFLDRGLPRYAAERNQPEAEVTSGLSPYLHFGQISAYEVFQGVSDYEGWSIARVGGTASGARSGFWGMSENAEAFLDQLLTWRELSYNFCWYHPDDDQYESLPAWSRMTLEQHASDPRPELYSLEQLEGAGTADPLWNAAQTELLRDGRIHNYLRMLWGKKILEWSPSPRVAHDRMVHLNNRYALDGRDPNSRSGISWVLGRYDRPWGPRRPVFGTVRYMSSANTARKLRLRSYLNRYTSGREKVVPS